MIDEKRLIEDIEKEFEGVCVYDVTASTAIRDFVEIVDKQPKVGEWIPCSERLPEFYELVLISAKLDEEDVILMGERWQNVWVLYSSMYKYDEEDFEVIAWMPLPPAYKEER